MTTAQLKAWRATMGFSLSDAADALGVSLRHYRRLESGERVVTLTLAKLAELLRKGSHR